MWIESYKGDGDRRIWGGSRVHRPTERDAREEREAREGLGWFADRPADGERGEREERERRERLWGGSRVGPGF